MKAAGVKPLKAKPGESFRPARSGETLLVAEPLTALAGRGEATLRGAEGAWSVAPPRGPFPEVSSRALIDALPGSGGSSSPKAR